MFERLQLGFWPILVACVLVTQTADCEEPVGEVSVQEIRSLLTSIDPYLPEAEVVGEIDIFGSTSMDSLVHGWANDFKKFHPQASVVISAEGSETVFDRLAKRPASLGMLSRPVSDDELEILRASGMKKPVAIMVAREALAVFVNATNPLESITKEQFFNVFSLGSGSERLTWGELGVEGKLADQPVQVLAREGKSGTQKFVSDFLFRGQPLRAPVATYKSNAQVIQAVESNPLAVAIAGLKCGGHGAKPLELGSGATVVPHDDHAVLMGRYPLMRPLTIVLDVGQDNERTNANREFLRYALHQAGQTQTILVGFFPFDPPTLRGEMLKLERRDGKE